MEVVRQSWTDERLDDLNGRVSEGFHRMDTRFAQIDARLDGMQRTMTQGFIALVGLQVAGLGAVLGFIATQS
jgi:hypothetical protein